MPKYFFHSRVGDLAAKDSDGTEFATDAAACREAIRTFSELARDEMPDRSALDIQVGVTDTDGRCLFTVSLDIDPSALISGPMLRPGMTFALR
jgi:hypothetical protein